MAPASTSLQLAPWKNWQKALFRFFFIYFIIQTVPFDWKFYRDLFSINWLSPELYAIVQLTRYLPSFFSEEILLNQNIASFANWGIAALLAVVGSFVWSSYEKKKQSIPADYNLLYYYLRAILRYRLAIGVIAYGLIKLFPIQIPPPTLSELHTNYGDFYAWKIYYLTTGLATNHYESSLGLIELIGGTLLLCRKTATIGAGLIATFIVNVVTANFAYHIGDHVYSTHLLFIALFLLAFDIPRLYDLFITNKPAIANKFKPDFSAGSWQLVRLTLKYGFLVVIAGLGFLTYRSYSTQPYVNPTTPGLAGTSGFYNVREFRLNDEILPYSDTNPDRWQNVVFEKWNTLSIQINKPVVVDNTLPGQNRFDGNYEQAGNAGRHYFSYQVDTLSKVLTANNKSRPKEKLSLHYSRQGNSTLVIKGLTQNNDSLYVILDKIEKKYLLKEGRRKPISL